MATVDAWARRAPPPPVPDDPRLQARAGAFVSLHVAGQLRGCIGHLEADRPLVECVAAMAVAAARDDPRFPPVQAAELGGLAVEVSVLTPAVPADATAVEPGRDGVIARRGGRQGVLLPQVATEYGWDREELLDQVCVKARLPARAWRDGSVELYVFRAQVISAPAPS